MNKLKKILLRSFTTSLLLCSLIFCSACSGFLTDNIWVSDSSTVLGSGFVRLRATILNYNKVTSDELISESSPSARSINPVMASQNYAFYLYGQKSSDMQNIGIGPSKINQISDTTGEFSMDIPKGIWVLTLVAVKDESGLDLSNLTKIKQNALLWGSTVCDYTNDSSPVNFILAPDGLSTKGTATIDIALSGWTVSDHIGVTGDNLENIKVKAGIYRYNKTGTERIVAEAELPAFIKSQITISDPDSGTNKQIDIDRSVFSPKDPVDSTKDLEISPGSYEFVISFYEEDSYIDPDSGDTVYYTVREWVWSDQINIFPGRETEGDVVVPRLINEPPAAPENFYICHYATNATDDSGNNIFASNDGLYYTCIFQWTDMSDTETGFEIRLTDIDDSSYSKTYNEDIENNKNLYVDGNLSSISGKNNTGRLDARVRLGHRIKAEIRSVCGDIGSDWVPAVLNPSTLPTNGVAFTRLTSDTNDSLYNVMNMYKVTYNFNGGKNSEAINLNNIGNVAINTLQDTYNFYGPDDSLNQISIADTDKMKINRSTNSETKYFNFWALTPVSTTVYSENPFASTNYQNIDIWAQYKESDQSDQQTQVQQQEKLEKRLQTYIKIANSSISDDAFTKNSSLSLTLGNTTKVELTNNVNRLTTWDSDTFKYEYMSISIKDENGITLFTGYGTNDDTKFLGIVTASKITINIPVTTENGFEASNTKIYTMKIQARPEKSTEIIPTTIYFKVTN